MIQHTQNQVRSRGSLASLGISIILALYCFTATAQARWNPPIQPINTKNLVPNSSFELGPDGWSSLGIATAGGGDLCGLYGDIQAGDAYDGDHCLRIKLGPEKTPVTHSDYSMGASETTTQAAPRAATLGWMPVEAGKSYTLSAYLRADRDGVPADLLFRFGGDVNTSFGSDTHSKRIALTRAWTRYTFSIVATHPDVFVAVGPNLLETPDADATVWADAIQLEATPDTVAGGEPTPTGYAPREAIEVGMNSGHYGNLFDSRDPLGFCLLGSNTTPTDARVEVRIRLEDYFGEWGPESGRVLEIPANKRSEVFLPLDVPGPGFYRAHLSWESGGTSHTRSIKLSVVDTWRSSDSAFGLNHIPATTEACGQLLKAGVSWARDWSMKWDAIEAVEGIFDFAEVDRQVDHIKNTGMHLLPLLPPQPSAAWSSEAPATGLPPVERTAYAPAPEHRARLNTFIATTVARYQDRVDYWEFLNEPLWVPWYCLPTSAGYTVDTYIELLKGASAAMKTADPDCKVIGGISIMAHSPMGDEFIQKGGLDYVDIYNLHPYPEGDGPEAFVPWMQRIQAAMDARGGRKPIWATELSYWATDDKPWSPWAPPNPNHWAANRQQASEREAADYNVRQAVILLAHGVEKIFWHSGLEGEVNNGSRDLENPLLGPEAVPQKFFAALAALANMLGPVPNFVAPLATPDTVEGRNTGNVHGYAFNGPERAVLIVWAPGTLNNGRADSPGRVPLGESPVYLTSSTMTAQALAEACTLTHEREPGSDPANPDVWALQLPEGVEAYTIVGTLMLPKTDNDAPAP